MPVNMYLFTRYALIKHDFLSIIKGTMPRLEALYTMENVTTHINLFVNNFNSIYQKEVANTSTPSKIGVTKDEFLALLEELGSQQRIYQKYYSTTLFSDAQKLEQLRDKVVLSALAVFSAREQQVPQQLFEEKMKYLELSENQLHALIKSLLLQESIRLQKEGDKTIKALGVLHNSILLLNGFILLITFGLSWLLSRIISKPLVELSHFAAHIDYNQLTPLLPVLSHDEIGQLQHHLNTMLFKLDKAKTNLIETSRSAGIAELATGILHNVGNTLNSINTSISLLSENVNYSSLSRLPKLVAILEENKNNLDFYLNEDERGKFFIVYFQKLIEQLESERGKMQEELSRLQKHLLHVNQIIAMQQKTAQMQKHIYEPIHMNELIEEVLMLFTNTLRKENITIETQGNVFLPVYSVKSKIQQILINLIKNAIDALSVVELSEKKLILHIDLAENQKDMLITVKDNGIGIAHKDLNKIFSFGFTRKKEGHGYGLHHCAVLARELGGDLQVESKGLNQGAAFHLKIPFKTK
ncbi:MAG: HAMP domain-containing sensor histidine kinase [Tatlockia sp.]|jgi:signal transduction histidine kinase